MKDLFSTNKAYAGRLQDSDDLKAFVLGLYTLKGVGWKTIRHLFQAYVQDKSFFSSADRLADMLQKTKTPNYKEVASLVVSSFDKIKRSGLEEYEQLKSRGIDLLIDLVLWEHGNPRRKLITMLKE